MPSSYATWSSAQHMEAVQLAHTSLPQLHVEWVINVYTTMTALLTKLALLIAFLFNLIARCLEQESHAPSTRKKSFAITNAPTTTRASPMLPDLRMMSAKKFFHHAIQPQVQTAHRQQCRRHKQIHLAIQRQEQIALHPLRPAHVKKHQLQQVFRHQ
jgi:hypothetical protein